MSRWLPRRPCKADAATVGVCGQSNATRVWVRLMQGPRGRDERMLLAVDSNVNVGEGDGGSRELAAGVWRVLHDKKEMGLTECVGVDSQAVVYCGLGQNVVQGEIARGLPKRNVADHGVARQDVAWRALPPVSIAAAAALLKHRKLRPINRPAAQHTARDDSHMWS